jgi:hypothetical protein
LPHENLHLNIKNLIETFAYIKERSLKRSLFRKSDRMEYFLIFLAVCVLYARISATCLFDVGLNMKWEAFKQEHGKTYNNTEEIFR